MLQMTWKKSFKHLAENYEHSLKMCLLAFGVVTQRRFKRPDSLQPIKS